MKNDAKRPRKPGTVCPVCKGTGLDKTAHRRYTTGGHDDRSCRRCHGECFLDEDDHLDQSRDEQRSVAVFRWEEELPGFGVETDPERLTTLAAQAPAKAIFAALRSQGCHADAESPYDGEVGWHFTVEIDGRTYGVFTLWTGITGANSFAVQTDLKRGAFSTLFRKPIRDERLEPVRGALDRALASLPQVKDLQWLSDEQFASSYCRGETLPLNDGSCE